MPHHLLSVPLRQQFGFLLLLGFAIACISWTVTHEEIFREPRDFCKDKSENCAPLYLRKFFYLFTCEYFFSHYVAALFLLLTQFKMLCFGCRVYVISQYSLRSIAHILLSTFHRL